MTLAESNPALDALTKYQWEPQPKAAAFLQELMDRAWAENDWLRDFADRTYRESGNRITDLVRLWIIPDTEENRGQLLAAGWAEAPEVPGDGPVFVNRSGMFPDVMLADHPETDLGLKVEFVADFAAAQGLDAEPWGKPGSPQRYVLASKQKGINVYGVESRGAYGWKLPTEYPSLEDQQSVLESFRARRRRFDDDKGFEHTEKLLDAAMARVGRDMACELFFAAEREYWERRNTAAQFQKARQDKLGIGWANHDHHTYRSSRRHFHQLVALWEKLGFECRERFYPGPEAGWGAQVMEQPVCGIVTFNDVDISPDELLMDFAHEPMIERDSGGGLGTVGLWCGLHGESVLQAGMHHLECTFDFEALEKQMAEEGGIKTMKKFTDLGYLKQAFTQGERWKVDPERVRRIQADGFIDEAQAREFIANGAIGSHLENLERNDGFKGFNQTGVTEIIHATDPRLGRNEE